MKSLSGTGVLALALLACGLGSGGASQPSAAVSSISLADLGAVLGQAAYFNNGADARQLWVKITDQAAMVVAFGDEPREDGAKALAELILSAVK